MRCGKIMAKLKHYNHKRKHKVTWANKSYLFVYYILIWNSRIVGAPNIHFYDKTVIFKNPASHYRSSGVKERPLSAVGAIWF